MITYVLKVALFAASSSSKVGSPLDAQQLHFEDERRSPGDLRRGSPVSVAQLGGDDQLPLLALAHAQQALVPAFDHLAGAQGEGEGSVAGDAAVELGAVLQLARVVHVQHVSLAGLDGAVVHTLLDADLQLLLLGSAHCRRAQRQHGDGEQQEHPHDCSRAGYTAGGWSGKDERAPRPHSQFRG